MRISKVKRVLVGEPLTSNRITEEKIPKWKALAVLSSDALSSVAYATEEILIPLAAFASMAMVWSFPISIAIISLILIVSLSYRQTIQAYPNGGGAYVVAKENLGLYPGLLAGAGLLIGYVLTVSVSISAGVSAITSAFPELAEYRIIISGILILILTWLNLRGIRESATVFAFPTYLFLFSFFIMLAVGAWKYFTGHIEPIRAVTLNPGTYAAVPLFLVLRAFSSGCAALTGIEAISNGVPAFRYPAEKNAKTTLTIMAVLLAVLFFGITSLSLVYGVSPISGGEAGVSQLARSILGKGYFYYFVQFATALILILAANTSYAGFPWLAAIIAKDRYLPRQFAHQGDRLVFSNSIIGLSIAAYILIIMFGGDTHGLIPLYAVGVFLGFTLSQTGMLKHHLKNKKPGWIKGFLINGLGAITTFVVMFVVGVTKFSQGAWIVVIVISAFVYFFRKIYLHYIEIGSQLSLTGHEAPSHLVPSRHTVIVPVSGIHKGIIEALKYAISISHDVRAVYIEINPEATDRLEKEWFKWGHDVPFVILKSPYRSIVGPLLEYINDVSQTARGDVTTVIIPEFITAKWWHRVLHNQTAWLIRAALLFKRGVVVTSVRYRVNDGQI